MWIHECETEIRNSDKSSPWGGGVHSEVWDENDGDSGISDDDDDDVVTRKVTYDEDENPENDQLEHLKTVLWF